MQTYAVVVDTLNGVSKKTGLPYQIYVCLGQNPEGEIGVLKLFLKPTEIGSKRWEGVRSGDVVSLELETKNSGFNSFINVVSGDPAPEMNAEMKFKKA